MRVRARACVHEMHVARDGEAAACIEERKKNDTRSSFLGAHERRSKCATSFKSKNLQVEQSEVAPGFSHLVD